MRARTAHCGTFATLLALVGCVGSNPPSPIELLDYGVYDLRGVYPTLIAQTDVVLAQLGTSMCVRARKRFAMPLKSDRIYRYEWRTPNIIDPATGAPFRREGSGKFGADENAVCYVFEHEWQLVPGQYAIRYLDGERLVLEKAFEVVIVLESGDDG